MSLGISNQSILSAYLDSAPVRPIDLALRDFNVVGDEGMVLKIPQDNLYDLIVNTLDSRRIKLEKQAEILHDYYGDRLLAKEIFERYLSYKSKTVGVAHVFSLGLIGFNLYSRVMKNSVFMGKLGTLGSIIALQYAGRYLSNNYLEAEIERPWKIHTYRMSKGMGPTNIPSNDHKEILTSPLRFVKYEINSKELLMGTYLKSVVTSPEIKVPIGVEHFPYMVEGEDINKFDKIKSSRYKRGEKVEPEDDGKFIQITMPLYMAYPFTQKLYENIYFEHYEMFKSFLLNGGLTLYIPEHLYKRVPFEATSFESLYKDTIQENNSYEDEPVYSEVYSELPNYAKYLKVKINVTEERIKTLRKLFNYFF
jgi:hypothetical protein